jgi:hypothetical protein
VSRQRQFHLDHAGHSITVTVRTGHAPEVELLVDGKEVGHQHGADSAVIAGDLPEAGPSNHLPGDLFEAAPAAHPPHRFEIRVDHLRHRAHAPSCTLLLDGRETPMPERALPRGPRRQLRPDQF